jgi:P27 family predicted phage terminase small subunit
MRGRKPKPTARQIVEGDPRKKGVNKLQAKLESEPIAARGLPDCPRHLRGRARAAWGFWKLELESMKLDCRPDAMMLEGACVNYAKAVQADLLVAAQGPVVEEPVMNSEGEQVGSRFKRNPADVVSNAAWRNVRAFCSEFGLSPVSRTRLTIEKADKEGEDLMQMLGAPRVRRDVSAVQ